LLEDSLTEISNRDTGGGCEDQGQEEIGDLEVSSYGVTASLETEMII
jgi:hypothetical protein